MRIPLSGLPAPILQRLIQVQQNPQSYDGYYQKGGGRGGAITGIVFCVLTLFAGIPLATETLVPLPIWIVLGILLCVGIWAGISHLRRFGKAELKPMAFLNPLYMVRVTLDEVRYHGLWAELKNLQIKTPIKFKVGYTVFPSKSIYSQRSVAHAAAQVLHRGRLRVGFPHRRRGQGDPPLPAGELSPGAL